MADLELEQLLLIDECTRTYNRRYFFQRLEEEVARAKRYGRNFALLFSDVDRFKEVNDVFGHLAGDDVLREVAVRLRDVVRGVDLVFRYAGDEFAVILPETTSRQAVIAAERLLEYFRRTPVYSARAKRDIRVTLSVGTAAFPADGDTAFTILENADKALLAAKARGRDQVCDQERARETAVMEERLARPVFCPRMVGREKERRVLRKALARAAGGRGTFVLISGETGVGKTRLVRDFVEFARLQGVVALQGLSFEEPTGFAYQPFREAVAAYLNDNDGAAAAMSRIPRAYQRELCNVVPELSVFGFEDAPLLELPPEQARLRLFVGFRYLLAAIATDASLAIVVEDLHWAEEGTLSLCRFLLNGLAAESIVIVGTFRPEELAERETRGGGRSLLSSLSGDRAVETLKLDRLGREGVAEMVRLIFRAPQVSPRFVDFVFRETEGNPLFVEEILKSFYEDGMSPRRYVVDGEPIPEGYEVPGTVRGIIKRRLSRLDDRTTRVLEAAAILREDFSADEIRAAVNLNEGLLADILGVCADQEIVIAVAGDLERYRFSHGKIRDEILRSTNRRRRKVLHKKLAAYFEQKYLAGENDVVAELSWHAHEGEMWEKVIVFAKLAGDRAWAVYDAAEALRHYDRMADAVTHIGKGGFGNELIRRELVDLHFRRGEIYLMLGKYVAAADVFEKAKVVAGEIGDDLALARAMNMVARAYGALGDEKQAVPNLEGALRIFKRLDATADLARAFYDLGEHRRRIFDLTRALSFFHMAEAVADKTNDGSLSMSVANGVGAVLLSRGDVKGAADHFKLALALARGLGDRRGETAALNDLGEAAFLGGRGPDALRHLNAGYEVAADLGNQPLMAATLLRMGKVAFYGGDLAAAAQYYGRAVELAHVSGDRRDEAESQYLLGVVHYRRGNAVAARAAWKTAIAAARKSRDALLVYRVRVAQAEVAADAGSAKTARRLLQQAAGAVEDLSRDNLEAAHWLAGGKVEMISGNAEEALRQFTAAAKAARASADPFLAGQSLLFAAAAAATVGHGARAAKTLVEFAPWGRKTPKKSWEGLYAWTKATTASSSRKRAVATREYKKAIAILSEIDAPTTARVQAEYGTYLATAGDTKAASPVLKTAAAFFEHIGNKKKAAALRSLAGA